MITTFLKVNQIFVSAILIFIGLTGLVLINYSSLDTNHNLIAFSILCAQVLFMSVFNQNNSFLSESNFALFFFIIFSTSFSKDLDHLSFYGGYFILNIIFFQILDNRDYKEKLFNPFDLSFLGILMVAMHPPFILFLFAILMHYIIMGKTQIKSLILSFLGFIISTLLILEIVLITDRQETFLSMWNNIHTSGFEWNHNYYFLIPVLIIAIISIIDYFQHLNKQKTNKKILFTNLFIILTVSILYIILYGNKSISLMVFCLPFSILLTNVSLYRKSLNTEISIWIIMLCLFLFRFFDEIQLPESLNMITF